MKILSIYPYTHLSSSALVVDGVVVAAAAEERFNRQKMSTKFPILSAEWCLELNNLKWNDLDMIVVPWNPMHNINDASKRWVDQMSWRGEMLSHIPAELMRAFNGPVAPEMEIRFGGTCIKYLNHHECHAANGFFLSPFKDSIILSIDGHGEKSTCLTGFAEGNLIRETGSVLYPHSIGLFYGTFTDFLGFKPDSDEWKVMALSAYSKTPNKYDQLVRSLISLTNEGFELDLTYFNYFLFDRQRHFFTKKFINLFGESRQKNTPFEERHYDIASAMQRVFTEAVTHMARIARNRAGGQSKNIILTGGAAMNSVFNGYLDQIDEFEDSFISASPDDSGVSVGAALLAYYRYAKDPVVRKPIECTTNFWGPAFTKDEIENIIKKFKLSYIEPDNLSQYVAEAIFDGNLIGWFQGAMEFGQRALGNRSILADPRFEATKDKVNSAVKYRESFRPFAPAVLSERAEEIFEIRSGRKVNFMERVYRVRKNWQGRLQAVTHVDGTGRVQTVDSKSNPSFYNLISEYDKISKIPVILNTSFNLNGEPIVCTPEDAIRTFYSCGLDILVLGPFLIKK